MAQTHWRDTVLVPTQFVSFGRFIPACMLQLWIQNREHDRTSNVGNFRGMGMREGQPGPDSSEGQGEEWKALLSKALEPSGGLEGYA